MRKAGSTVTDEALRTAIMESNSISEALRRLGKTPNGATHTHFTQRAKRLGISTDHFDKDKWYPRSLANRSPESVLVRNERNHRRVAGSTLKKALLRMGVPYKCAIPGCPMGAEWMGRPISLQVDHIDGDRFNNLKENLRFLCPPCHTQTETYGYRGGGAKTPETRFCAECGVSITTGKTGFCIKHWKRPHQKEKIQWPTDEELVEMIRRSSRLQTSKKLGVSETAVRKRIKTRQLVI